MPITQKVLIRKGLVFIPLGLYKANAENAVHEADINNKAMILTEEALQKNLAVCITDLSSGTA